jgi:hypothetical protein
MTFASFGWHSLLGVLLANRIGKARIRKRNHILASSATTFVIASLVAGLMGYLLCATAPIGVWLVAFTLGFCWAAYNFLNILSQPRSQ